MKEALRTIEQTTRIAASPETVWKFWTDPVLLAEWFGTRATADPRPGGTLTAMVSESGTMIGEFVELDPPHRLVFTFGWSRCSPGTPLAPGSTLVEVTLTADGPDTIVRLRHSQMPDTHERSHRDGWAICVGKRLVDAVALATSVDV